MSNVKVTLFDPIAKKRVVISYSGGKVEVDYQGFIGGECDKADELLQTSIGFRVEDERRKPEGTVSDSLGVTL